MNDEIVIAWTCRRDLPQMLAIEDDSFHEPWSEDEFTEQLRQKNVIAICAHAGGRIVGYVIYELHSRLLRVINLAVALEFRRNGIGTKLVNHLKEKIGGRNRITAEVSERNTASHLFFRAVGFRATQVLHDWYANVDDDAYLFEFRSKSAAAAAERQKTG
jgi:ribosomal-protein-alanine N-acetyltransferase